jgi:hypothetical protein
MKTKSPKTRLPEPKRFRRLVFLAILALGGAALGIGYYFYPLSSHPPEPPDIARSGIDPALGSAIDCARQRLSWTT